MILLCYRIMHDFMEYTTLTDICSFSHMIYYRKHDIEFHTGYILENQKDSDSG